MFCRFRNERFAQFSVMCVSDTNDPRGFPIHFLQKKTLLNYKNTKIQQNYKNTVLFEHQTNTPSTIQNEDTKLPVSLSKTQSEDTKLRASSPSSLLSLSLSVPPLVMSREMEHQLSKRGFAATGNIEQQKMSVSKAASHRIQNITRRRHSTQRTAHRDTARDRDTARRARTTDTDTDTTRRTTRHGTGRDWTQMHSNKKTNGNARNHVEQRQRGEKRVKRRDRRQRRRREDG